MGFSNINKEYEIEFVKSLASIGGGQISKEAEKLLGECESGNITYDQAVEILEEKYTD